MQSLVEAEEEEGGDEHEEEVGSAIARFCVRLYAMSLINPIAIPTSLRQPPARTSRCLEWKKRSMPRQLTPRLQLKRVHGLAFSTVMSERHPLLERPKLFLQK